MSIALGKAVKEADAPLLSRRPQEDGPTSRGTNSLIRLVTNDIILLHLTHYALQGCVKSVAIAGKQCAAEHYVFQSTYFCVMP